MLLSLWSPACLPYAPALRPHPAVGTALGWGLQYLLRHQQQSWRWFSGLTTGTPGCASPSAPPAPNTPPHPTPGLSGLGFIRCVPGGILQGPSEERDPPLRGYGVG